MLNRQDKERLDKILEDITVELSGNQRFSISFGDVHWLALKCQELNNDSILAHEGKTQKSDKLIIQQAKEILMHKYGQTENEAHRFIIKLATENRMTKVKIAVMLIDAETREC